MNWKLLKKRGGHSADYSARWARGDFDTTDPSDLYQPQQHSRDQAEQSEHQRRDAPPPAPQDKQEGRW